MKSFVFSIAIFLSIASTNFVFAAGTPIKVALYNDVGAAGKGVPCVYTELGKFDNIAVTKVSAEQIRNGILDDFDVVVFTGGIATAQSRTLKEQGRAKVKEFVEHGGGYMGICAGAYLACNGFNWAVGVLDAKTVSPKWQRGEGTVQIELTPQGQKLLGQTNNIFALKYENGPIIEHNSGLLPKFKTLATYRTEKAENGTPVGAMIHSPAIVTSTFGNGRVVVISPHPEQSPTAQSMIPAAIRWLAHREHRLATPRAT